MTGTGDPTQIRQDIEATREELGETVEALAAKTDVTGQAKRRIEEARASVSGKAEEVFGRVRDVTPETATAGAGQAVVAARQSPMLLIGMFAAGLLIGRLTRRR